MTTATTLCTITDHEAAQVARANATGAIPVVFVHGLWLVPSSWDRRDAPGGIRRQRIREIADYEEAIIRRLDRKPVIIGHSFGGLLTMMLARRCPSPRCAPSASPCATRRTGTARCDSPTSSSGTAPRRGHALTIDRGWPEVAETVLAFVKRFTEAPATRRRTDVEAS